ncbi:MAG: hypothetical protein WCA22_18790 [Candidatus Binatus sp.]
MHGRKKVTRDQTIRWLSGGEAYTDHVTLACPVCGDDCSHIREIFTRMGCDEHEARVYPGTHAKEVSSGWRRSAVVIVIDGESCGHVWNLVIQQHKGVNFIEIETGHREESDGEPAFH